MDQFSFVGTDIICDDDLNCKFKPVYRKTFNIWDQHLQLSILAFRFGWFKL